MVAIQTAVDAGVRDKFIILASKKGVTEAALYRQILLAHLGDEPISVPVQEPVEVQDYKRLSVYLPLFLHRAVAARAKSNGIKASTWVANLIQSNLTQRPVMLHNEIGALNSSNRELAAVGRNINQIAKALNERPGDVSILNRSYFDALLVAVDKNRNSIRSLLRSSQRAWGEG